MKFRLFSLCTFLVVVLCLPRHVAAFGVNTSLNDGWEFRLDSSEKLPQTADWQSVDLPHDWSVKGAYSSQLYSATGYLPGGIGWYKKSIFVPAERSNRRFYIYFEGVYNRSQVYLNGHLLGSRPNGYISFIYDMTPYLKFGAENTISVRVDHSRQADSRWYTGSGIYRNVWLIEANSTHIKNWGVYAYPESATDQAGRLCVETQIVNHGSNDQSLVVTHELIDCQTGILVGKSKGKIDSKSNTAAQHKTALTIRNPKLWSLDSPHLYLLKTCIYQRGRMIDSTTTRTAFRTFAFDPDKGFSLNGKSMKLKGVCLHHDSGVLGAEFYESVWRRRLESLKALGCNAIRTSHNPQSPAFYDLCDEIGMLVLNEAYDEWEFPKRKWLEGWNVGTPGFEGNCDYFEEYAERDLADMVCRDRNHPSIFAWSIGNEVDYPNDPYSHPILGGGETGFTQAIYGGYKPDAPDATRLGAIAKKLVAVVKKYDSSRPTTAGLAGVAMSNETEYPEALDITGYNYTESRYQSDHQTYPTRVIYGSETRHDYSAWQSVVENDHIAGQFIWTGIDYLGESGAWPSRGFYSGLLDFGGFRKPRGYFRAALWSENPVIYLGTYPTPRRGGKSNMKDVWSQSDASADADFIETTPSMDAWALWNYEQNELVRVVCYTNAPEVVLTLNGRQIGCPKEKEGIKYWDIPYEAGELVVTGCKQGSPICTQTLCTTTQPHAIVATVLERDANFVQVLVQVVDEAGRRVMNAENEITCVVGGAGVLLGMEGSNNEDMGDYRDNKQRVYKGQLVVYIKTQPAAKIDVQFTAPQLKSCNLKEL